LDLPSLKVLILNAELLSEHCHTDNLTPNIFPPGSV